MEDLTAARDLFDLAARDYKRGLDDMFETDDAGRRVPKLGPEQHRKAEAALLENLVAAERRALAVADKALAASAERRLAAFSCPTAGMSESTLRRVELLRGVIAEEISSLDPAVLARRVDWIVQHGDDAQRFLYLRGSARRWRQESRKTPPVPGTDKLGESLRAADALLRPNSSGVELEADRMRDDAQLLRLHVSRTLQAARTGGRRPPSTL